MESNQLDPVFTYNFEDFPSTLEFSQDSQLLLAGLYKRGIVEIRSLESDEWTCKIDGVLNKFFKLLIFQTLFLSTILFIIGLK